MPQLLVRKVSPKLIRRLKRKAAELGVSAEEEHRRILESALVPEATRPKFQILKDLLMKMPTGGDDALFERSREMPRNIDLP
jgi:plasmid stability protein